MSAVKLKTSEEPDRREALRGPLDPIAVSVRDDDGNDCAGTLKDLSRSGALLFSRAEYPLGANLCLEPPQEAGLTPIKARVVRVEKSDDTGWQYGLQFPEGGDLRRHHWWLALRKV